jgi:CRP-like cAMP-binding protein
MATSVRRASAGERIVRRGDAGRSVFWVLEGRTCAVILEQRSARVLEEHEPGAFFGEIAALTKVSRQVDVIAVQRTTLLELQYAALSELMEHSAVRALLIERLVERWKRLRPNDAD